MFQYRFATSKTKLDIQYNKLGIRVVSLVAKQFKDFGDIRTLKNIRKITNLAGDLASWQVSFPEIKL